MTPVPMFHPPQGAYWQGAVPNPAPQQQQSQSNGNGYGEYGFVNGNGAYDGYVQPKQEQYEYEAPPPMAYQSPYDYQGAWYSSAYGAPYYGERQ
jgi:hypothetical protein